MSVFYIMAGLNHFVSPDFYYPLIPDYLGFPKGINILSGGIELLFGVGLLVAKTRSLAVYGIILMLLAFIPSHVYFIQIGSCINEGLCVPEWVGWIRLILVHPLLIFWAWSNR